MRAGERLGNVAGEAEVAPIRDGLEFGGAAERGRRISVLID